MRRIYLGVVLLVLFSFAYSQNVILSTEHLILDSSQKSPDIEISGEGLAQGIYPVYVDVKPEHGKTFRENY